MTGAQIVLLSMFAFHLLVMVWLYAIGTLYVAGIAYWKRGILSYMVLSAYARLTNWRR